MERSLEDSRDPRLKSMNYWRNSSSFRKSIHTNCPKIWSLFADDAYENLIVEIEDFFQWSSRRIVKFDNEEIEIVQQSMDLIEDVEQFSMYK